MELFFRPYKLRITGIDGVPEEYDDLLNGPYLELLVKNEIMPSFARYMDPHNPCIAGDFFICLDSNTSEGWECGQELKRIPLLKWCMHRREKWKDGPDCPKCGYLSTNEDSTYLEKEMLSNLEFLLRIGNEYAKHDDFPKFSLDLSENLSCFSGYLSDKYLKAIKQVTSSRGEDLTDFTKLLHQIISSPATTWCDLEVNAEWVDDFLDVEDKKIWLFSLQYGTYSKREVFISRDYTNDSTKLSITCTKLGDPISLYFTFLITLRWMQLVEEEFNSSPITAATVG